MRIKEKSAACVQGEIRLADGLDNRMFNLLRAIDQSGSINQASKQLGISFKTAWMMIERANNASSKNLIASETGGASGGGTSLTESGRALLNAFTRLEAQHKEFLYQLNRAVEAEPEILRLIKPLTIKTSADNQIFGVVTALKQGAVHTEASVNLKGGEKICARVNHGIAESLELKVGGEVVILINDLDIYLFTGPHTHHVLVENQLLGLISRVQFGVVDAQIIIYLQGGNSLTAIITRQSALNMGLKVGMQCMAVFNSDAVLLGVL